jgi:hypothetical protein
MGSTIPPARIGMAVARFVRESPAESEAKNLAAVQHDMHRNFVVGSTGADFILPAESNR